MKRRAAVVAAAAATGLAAGVAGALWRSGSRVAEATGGADAAGEIWRHVFTAVDGTPVPMATLRGRPLVLNFWATWCPPCVVEMPLLDDFARTRAGDGWQVLALALDDREKVRHFLSRRSWSLQVAVAESGGVALGRQLGNTQGGLPFTAIFDGSGRQTERRIGAVDAEWLAAAAMATAR